MRKSFLPILCLLIAPAIYAQVGIGTTSPLARLHVADSSVLFSAIGAIPSNAGNPPLSGGGRRMMWYPDKAAFRAGYVDNTNWDKDSIGVYSFGAGLNPKATGGVAISLGFNSIASGNSSVALGNGAEASGHYSLALGINSTASEAYATAIGNNTVASNANAMAFGANSIASGLYSTAFGRYTTAPSAYETTIGKFSTTYTPNSASAHNAADRLFTIGNGTDINNRSDALVMLKNGNTGLGTSLPQVKLQVEGGSGISGTTGGFLQLGAGSVQNLALDPNEIQSRSNGSPSTLLLQARGGNLSLGNAFGSGKVYRPASGNNDLLPVAFGKVFGDGAIHTGTGNFTITKDGDGVFELVVNGVSPASATLILTPRGEAPFIRTLTYSTNAGNVFRIFYYRMEVVYNSSLDVTSVKPVGFNGDFNFVVYYY